MTNDSQFYEIRFAALAEVLPCEAEPALCRDLGAERQFKVKAQRGECAA